MSEDLSWADTILREAEATGDERLKAQASVQRGLLRLVTEPQVTPEELIVAGEEAIEIFEPLNDDLGLARAWRLIGQAHYLARHAGPSSDSLEHALAHARRSGDRSEVRETAEWFGVTLTLGPAAASDALLRGESLLDEAAGDGFLEVILCSLRANLEAMRGRAAEADALFARARRALDEGSLRRVGYFAIQLALAPGLGLAAGEMDAVKQELQATCEALEEIGEQTNYSTVAALLARTHCAQGRYDEAERYTNLSQEAARPNDVLSQIFWRSTRGKVLAHNGEHAAGESLAREAVAFAERSDFLNSHADALVDLADVSAAVGNASQGSSALNEARILYERKGNLVMAERTRKKLREPRAGLAT